MKAPVLTFLVDAAIFAWQLRTNEHRDNRELEPRAGAGAVVRTLLAWVLIATTAAVAIFAVRAPAPVPATAPADAFSAKRALVHVRTIAYAPHPIGSAENERVRNYQAGQLSALGFNPQVFEALGVESGGRSVIIGDTPISWAVCRGRQIPARSC